MMVVAGFEFKSTPAKGRVSGHPGSTNRAGRRTTAHDGDHLGHRAPPLGLAAPVLEVGLGNHLGDAREPDAGALDDDRRGVGVAGVELAELERRVEVLLEEVDALDREADRARAVARRGDAALKRVPERDGPRVEEVLALLGDDVGDDLGRVRLGRVLGAGDRPGSASLWRRLGKGVDSLDDETAFTLARDVLLVALLEELDVVLEHLERDTSLGRVDEVRAGLRRGGQVLVKVM